MEHQVAGANRSPIVLVIDDDQNDRDLTVRFLKKHFPGARVQTCKTSQDGLHTMENYLTGSSDDFPSLVMLDLKMPGMNGDALMRSLSDRRPLGNLPIVLFSSSALPEDVDRCMKTGVKSYVQKPIDYYEYDEAIRDVCASWLEDKDPSKTN